LRRFNRWSEAQAKAVGLTHAQHQLLLAVRGHCAYTSTEDPPTIGDLAAHLFVRHHSAVELVDRVESAGYVRRQRDERDARVARVVLTRRGEEQIARLTELHVAELRRLAPVLQALVKYRH
jgi:DNA-binding MarR family transcriptional regulator